MKAKNKVGKKVDRFENKVDDKLKEKLLDDEYVIDDRVVISESSDYVY